jgi:hypothetical protein
MDDQPELPLPPPPLRPDQPYLPARMVNEFQYCPRLAYLEWAPLVAPVCAPAIPPPQRRLNGRDDTPGWQLGYGAIPAIRPSG